MSISVAILYKIELWIFWIETILCLKKRENIIDHKFIRNRNSDLWVPSWVQLSTSQPPIHFNHSRAPRSDTKSKTPLLCIIFGSSTASHFLPWFPTAGLYFIHRIKYKYLALLFLIFFIVKNMLPWSGKQIWRYAFLIINTAVFRIHFHCCLVIMFWGVPIVRRNTRTKVSEKYLFLIFLRFLSLFASTSSALEYIYICFMRL